MKNESQTLYIPLYGKALMSREGLFPDPTAERIVSSVACDWKKVDQSRKLAIYMSMRAAQFDQFAAAYLQKHPSGVVLHLGCGLDSRCVRVKLPETAKWYDVDFPEVIDLRKQYYTPTPQYQWIASSVTAEGWLSEVSGGDGTALVLAEGLTMYLTEDEVLTLMQRLHETFPKVYFLFDAYSSLALRLSKYRNPVNAMQAKVSFSLDQPETLIEHVPYARVCLNRDIIRPCYVERLPKVDAMRFRFMGKAGKNLYRIFGYTLQ